MDVGQVISATLTALPSLCTTTLLPASGIMTMGANGLPTPLSHPTVYQYPCPTGGLFAREVPEAVGDTSLTQHGDTDDSFPQSNFRDPFYASTFPICYALAATTVTAYMLVIMLFITPRSFLDGGIVYLGRRGGFTNGPAGGVTIGGRPWLQKVAALTVAISLTVASADTFRVAQKQYMWGIQNATSLQDEVMGSVELKAIRIISDTFLWLAQAQTLIRLFPRQREKIIIKWVAFALITLDVIFSALNSFKYSDNGINSNSQPKNFVEPVPALSYLFQLSLGFLYAAWVIYYAMMKKRYAFYHPFMKNMYLVAIISVTSVVIPVVFFILDISKPEFTGWGDYVRWVGAAAASVVVWEWVERIESLEREEKKDGILGREVFEGDDMLEVNAVEFPRIRNRKSRKGGDGEDGDEGETRQDPSTANNSWPTQMGRNNPSGESEQRSVGGILRPPIWPARPAPAVTPVSRTDTASAASTIYAIRYQPPSETTTRTPDPFPHQSLADLSRQNSTPRSHHINEDSVSTHPSGTQVQSGQPLAPTGTNPGDLEANSASQARGGWRTLTYGGPIIRQSTEDSTREPTQSQLPPPPPPPPVDHHEQIINHKIRDEPRRWDLKARFEEFAVNQAEKLRDRMRTTPNTEDLPIMVIPAPPRRGAALQQVLEEEELNSSDLSPSRDGGINSNSNTSDEMGQMGHFARSRSTISNSQGDAPLNPSNPPLWPGVQSRRTQDIENGSQLSFEDDEEEVYISDRASQADDQRGSDSSGPRIRPRH